MKKKNKDRESDALLVYHRYWDSYSNGDLEAFTSTLDEGFEMVGTSESEVCHSKDDGIAFFKSQMHEIVGRTEMRNRNIVAKEVNGMFLINEICDVYIFGEPEWTFYSRLRLSTLLHETESGWKVIQQHGSLPDMRVQEGETIAFDKISKENLELRDAVRRRTAELENKNRELAIEAALEKVRAVAMGMKNPNAMLDVCRVIAEQLEEFGVTKIRNVQTAIIDEHIGQYLCYQYFPAYGQTTIEDTEYHKSPVEHEMVRQMLASRDGHFTGSLSGKELEEFGLHRKEENHFPDPLLDAASEVSYCFLSIGEGGLGLSLYKEMEAAVLELFKRFHQVFSLAYQRFRDIQKAEEQTREAQIEVAVERVRAQSMAMHHPDELDKVNKEILTQLNWLQIQGLSGVTFYLVDLDGWVKAYDFSSPGNIGNQNSYTLQFDFKKYEMLGYPFKIFEQTDLNYFVADYPLEKLEKAVFEIEEINPEVATVIKEALAKGILTHQWTACARITDGLLGIDLVNPPSEDTKTIVLKIAGAFNQAYQRFLDLQKAEAQAREAQIEAALERIRSRALAMHTSNEIFEVAFVLREQMGLLGQPELEASVVHLYDTTNGIGESWHAFRPANENLGEITQGQFQFQKDECALTREFFELYESGQKEYTIPAQGEQLRDWVLLLIEKSPDIKKSWGGVIPAIGYHHFSTFSGGALLSVTREEVSDEGRYLQRRAASVFDLAYKRYLDLQKAEAQAKEAQIEAALERVRSRSMAMHKSDELLEAGEILFSEMQKLGIESLTAGFVLMDKEEKNGLNYTPDPSTKKIMSLPVIIPHNETSHMQQVVENWKTGNPFFIIEMDEEETIKHQTFIAERSTNFTLNAEQLIAISPARLFLHNFYFKEGYLLIVGGTRLSAEQIDIMLRFVKVFQQTYTRFLDLQKAEAQAREAQIEAALERVRSRSLAMHNSEDLENVILVVSEQLQLLQFRFENVSFGFDTSQMGLNFWLASPSLSRPILMKVPYINNPAFNNPFQARRAGKDFNVDILSREENQEFLQHMFDHSELGNLPEENKKFLLSTSGFARSQSLMKHTILTVGNYALAPYSNDQNATLKRFGIVFEQAYVRFLDLQKAEAQAREAQIEAALERVRSRSLAMHNSEELREVVSVLYDQMESFGFARGGCELILCNEKSGYLEYWHTNPVQSSVPECLNVSPSIHDFFDRVWKAWKAQEPLLVIEMRDEEKHKMDRALFEKTDFKKTDEKTKNWILNENVGVFSHATMKYGLLEAVDYLPLSENQFSILQRFAKVFEQTYSRFLDLQKAEAQAREAQIEAALERVRAKTMAMHNSEQLPETAQVLFEQFAELGKIPDRIAIGIIKEELQVIDWWVTDQMGSQLARQFNSSILQPTIAQFFTAWKEGKDSIMVDLSGEALKEWVSFVRDEVKMPIDDSNMNGRRVHHGAFFSHGLLLISAHEMMPSETMQLLVRFAKVFSQTYTRFLDLQKAEAQAREAQIEAALERVRAKTMAMHNSEDVSSAIATLFSELDRQSIENVRCGIAIIDTNKTMDVWSVTNVEETHPDKSLGKMVKASGTLDMNAHKLWQLMYDAWRNKTGYLYYHLSGKDKQKYIDLINTAPGYLSQPLRELPDMHCQFYFFNEGAIWAYSLQPHTEPQQPVMKRFTSVFSQTYLRYRDLQKAEAQAREAQIEAALERVRSRSMAMHKSEELKEVIQLLFEQFRLLNFKIDSAQFDPNYKENDDLNLWTAAPGQPYSILLNIPYVDSPLFNSIKEAKKRGLSFITQQLSYEDKNQFFRHFFQHIKNIPAERQKLIFESPGMYRAVVFMENVSLAIQNYSNTPYTEEENEVLKRFGKTFEQVYTRFLDLQKAEAQAREAQIEAALERVRSRSLAMHHSSELSAVVDTLLREFTSLEFTLTFCIINLIDEQDMSNTVWAANPETGKDPESYYMKFEDYPFHHAMWDAWKAQKKRFVYTIEGKEKKIYDEYLYSETEFRRFPKHVQEANKALDRYVVGFTFFKYSGLQTVSLNPISEDELEILERFGRVFEQAYTRFLDLQKAEAQGREAQIQLALERVRARTMSMQKSQELPEAANLLFQQIQSLGMPAWSAGYCTWKEDLPTEKEGKSAVTLWMSSEGVLQPPFTAPTTEDKLFIQMREGAEKGKDLHVVELGGKELEQHYRYMRELPVVGEILDSIIEAGHPLPSFQIMHQAYFSKGFLLFITYEPVPESHDIFKRFAKVFDQTYTRFLDLQKAEAQAREAKIEAALERVRSRTMAMFKSEELSEVAEVLFTQVSQLGGMPDRISICVIDEPNQSYQVWATDQAGTQLTVKPVANLKEKTTIRHLYADWKSGKKSSLIELQGPELKEWIAYLLQELGMPISTNHLQGRRFHNVAYFSHGWLNLSTSEPVADEVSDLLQRFASVFSLTYTRFLDLQKAEAQAREAQIEASLERVRSTSLAMHTSQDLSKVVYVVFTELIKLDAQLDRCLIQTVNPETLGITWYLTGKEGLLSNNGFLVENNPHPSHQAYLEGWRTKRKKWHYLLEGEEKKSCDEYLFSQTELAQLPDFIKADMAAVESIHLTISSDDFGCLIASSISPLPEAHAGIVDRFTSVFNQTYTRFLDLQKAEAQAREAQIEAALERVRSRAMAMHNSQELKEVALELRKQMGLLGQKDLEVCAIHLYGYGEDSFESWSAMKAPGSEAKIVQSQAHFPKRGIRITDEMMHHYTIGTKDYVLVNEGEKMAEWFKVLKKHAPELHASILDSLGKKPLKQLKGNWAVADFSGGALVMVTYGEPDEVSRNLLRRSANVFEQAYVRFLDLQKAEAQAREAQVEAALERLRSKTMAMHNSRDVGESVATLFDELSALGVLSSHDRCGIGIMQPHEMMEVWTAEKSTGKTELTIGYLDMRPHALLRNVYQSWLDRKETFHYTLEGEDKQLYAESIVNQPRYKIRKDYFSSLEVIEHTDFFFEEGCLYIFSVQPISNESAAVFSRFVKVFGQTYRRYLDLQKAEKQAREAQIEAALEKVRSRSLAMQSPDELIEVARLLREEMGALGVEELETSSIYIQDESSGLTQCWFTIKNPDNPDKAITDQMVIDLQDTWVGQKMDEFYRSKAKQTSILMQGEERIEWIRYCEEKSDLFGTSNFYGETIPDRTYHLYKFSNGYIGAAAPGEISKESWDLLKRATTVFSFAYTRFRDIQMAQSSARAAMRQASLDRVRADISSMRNAEDLDRITPLIFKELTVLGVPFIRCGVFIIQEKQKIVEAYLSSPEGNSLGVLRLPYQASELTYQTVEAWRKGEVFKQHWNKEDFIQWINQLMELDQIQDSNTYQGSAAPPESLDLHFVPFTQGMIYVGAVYPLDDKDLELVQVLAKAFSIAYARFEDFVKLEQAKAEIESAMSELKATQSQLVQQEKLASLGQLTAGIAHEIKNPLNFVNNFSEVSIEIIEETLEEMEKREARDETLIRENLEDIKSNLKKVHEHGSRANGIVTSMLQHSRGGTGKKEATDLNALIQEYVNLSFHGMRAGKNPINVDIILDLDPEIKEVSLIKEDFSRVIINLCNNAFDAMKSVKTLHAASLRVSTKKQGDKITIEVSDNGPGIPDDIKDKILQPFFTTKKGTEGTGLGLSITHDIIKAHGGELEIETSVNKGTKFIIKLTK
ncbi:ATP-binding protein [Cognataquiflexum aquatile]|uniref:ATP-binding protein n=1 Tax=Cognataquiflexum aquatile TaxID=2249427 RepID=UPI0018E5976F|nr:ATP-binding protein [Cognataquiflexum aquatile]